MRAVVSVCWILVVSAVLAACATRDPFVTTAGQTKSGEWQIENQIDRVTGAKVPSVMLTCTSSNNNVDDPNPGALQMTCFGKKPLVRFGFEFKVGSDSNSFIGYRFDDKPGRDNIAGVRFLQDYRMVVIDDRADVAHFVSDLEGSSKLYVRIRSLNAGRTSAEFNVEGYPAAVQAAFADCPLTPEIKPERKKIS